MTQQLLYIAMGGAIGSVLRFLTSYYTAHIRLFNTASGTLLVNLAGSFLIGFFMSFLVKNSQNEFLRLFLIAGILGGFTTFSAFSLENMHLIKEGDYKNLLLNVSIQTIGGLLLALMGYFIGNKL
jgi:fluoride exporter